MEPMDAALGRDGRLYLGRIRYKQGEPVASGPVEMTSQGPQVNGLNARQWISAGYACHLYQPGEGLRPFIQRVDERREDVSAPVMEITSGVTIGFRYLQFGLQAPTSVTVCLRAEAPLTLFVHADSMDGKVIASASIAPGAQEITLGLTSALIGRHAVYFAFASASEGVIASFDRFTFD